jgi:flagellar biogenesis protein FliO
MLAPLVLLPLVAVVINDVKAESSSGSVTIEIATSDPVASSNVRVASGGLHRLYVYLDDSVAKSTSFGGPAETILVHPRARYTKLEVPTSSRCGDPIAVAATADGVRVRATCRDGSAAASTGVPPVRVGAGGTAEHPLPEAPRIALVRDKQAGASLRAALTLPGEAATDGRPADDAHRAGPARSKTTAEPATAEAQHAKAAPNTKAEDTAKAQAQVPTAPAAAEAPIAPVAAVPAGGASPGKDSSGEQKSGAGSIAMALAAVLLLGAGVALARFARRRITRDRMIRILETASIGPRRSLVVACVGERTMVLGVSEAGVSLLDAQTPPVRPAGAPQAQPSGPVEDAALGLRNLAFAAGFAQESRPEENKHESSLLGRLFRRPPRASEGLEAEDFDQVFSESLEDEDLRRKLARGESGRVA